MVSESRCSSGRNITHQTSVCLGRSWEDDCKKHVCFLNLQNARKYNPRKSKWEALRKLQVPTRLITVTKRREQYSRSGAAGSDRMLR